MTALDIIVLLAVGFGALLGLMRGFVVEVFSLAAWIAGVAAVKIFHAPAAAALTAPVGTSGGASVLAFALVFGVVFFAVRLIGGRLGQGARSSVLGPIDRLLGLGFGAFKGLLVMTLVFLLVTLIVDTARGGAANRPDWMTRSRSYPLLRATSAALVDFVETRRAPARTPA